MKTAKRAEMEKFVESQRLQLGLDEDESRNLLQQALSEPEEHKSEVDLTSELELDLDDGGMDKTAFAEMSGQNNRQPLATAGPDKKNVMYKRRLVMNDPYLSESQTIKARPSKVSSIRSLFFEHALPNEYIVQIGVKDAKPVLGGKYFKLGKRFLKFPAAVQTVYFTSDNANKNYQGLRIDGYACWRIDPEKTEIAVRSLDFTDRSHPMGNTNRILRTICTEAIRHIIANISIEDALTKKDEIGLNLKSQLERVERSWGIVFDQVGIERVTILSSSVFEDLQQKTRDGLRLGAAQSRMETDQAIQKRKAGHTEEMEALNCETDKKNRILRAKTESETHRVELEERVKRETEDRSAQEQLKKAETEAAERSAVQKSELEKRQFVRETGLESLKNQEKHKLETAKAASEAQSRMQAAETEAKIAEVQARTELEKTEANHKKDLRQQELAAIVEILSLEKETEIKEKRLAAELKAQTANFEQKLRETREQAQVNQEMEILRLERLRIEEEIKNKVSETRVMAGLVARLPEIVSSLHVDRYTVFSGNGEAPLSHLFAQIFDLLGEDGISRFLKKEE